MKTRRSFLASLATLAAAPLALLGLKRAAGGNPPEPQLIGWIPPDVCESTPRDGPDYLFKEYSRARDQDIRVIGPDWYHFQWEAHLARERANPTIWPAPWAGHPKSDFGIVEAMLRATKT